MTIPTGFKEKMRRLLGEESEEFLAAMEAPASVAVRLNSRKPGAEFAEGEPVKWCRKGYYLPERPVFTLDPLLHCGAYYVQDASSMIYETVMERLVERFGGARISVLDMCAAPGGKTTAMIDALPDGSRVVANEYVGKRAGILRENLTKWGYPGVSVTNMGSERFAALGNRFDVVAVDAPCSGEGMMRKDRDAVEQWSEELIRKCASLQREILRNAAEVVAPGGYLIYSTCTFNREENEENADYIAGELGLEPVDLGFPEEWGIRGGIDTEMPVKRFMPHKTRGEGLFLGVFRKPGEWTRRDVQPMPAVEAKRMGKGKKGKGMERKEKGMKDEPPTIEEILSVDFDRVRYPIVELTKDQAISYLRREAIVLPAETPRGIVIMSYKGLAMGAAKNIGSRANNLYPKGWRVLI